VGPFRGLNIEIRGSESTALSAKTHNFITLVKENLTRIQDAK